MPLSGTVLRTRSSFTCMCSGRSATAGQVRHPAVRSALKAAGFSEPQASGSAAALAAVLEEAVPGARSSLAAREDVLAAKGELSLL